jgi:hypothetical protein
MIETTGYIHFDPINVSKKHEEQSSWKTTAMALLKDDTEAYYRWFLERRFNLKLIKSIRGSHLTFLNEKFSNIKVDYEEAKKFFTNKSVKITYDPKNLRFSNGFWFILAESDDLMNVRKALGLGDPYFHFHITIGNTNELNKQNSEYIKQVLIARGDYRL